MVGGKVLVLGVAGASLLFACGGESTRQSTPSRAGADGTDIPDASTSPTDSGTSPTDSGGPTTTLDPIDDMDPSDDLDGPLSSGFLWSHGLGNWFVSPPLEGRSADAPIDIIDPPRGTSTQACHVTGTGYAGGLDLWAQLNHPAGDPVDLSAYYGFTFWARLSSPSRLLRVGVNQVNLRQQVPNAPAADTQAFSIGPAWELLVVKFAELSADPTAVVSIDFITGEDGEDFDLWVDDLALVCDGPCPGP